MDEKVRKVALMQPLPCEWWNNSNWSTDSSPGIITRVNPSPVEFVQRTQSRGHAWPSAERGKTDVGGDFSTSRITDLRASDYQIFESDRSFGQKYIGQQFAYSPYQAVNDALSRVSFSTDIQLRTKGATAIARTIPTNPVADAGTFIGELKSGLPKLVGRELFKTKLKDYRKIGDEYLNVEFGWKPLISDLQKFGEAAIQSEKIIAQLHRDSGRNIHRKFTFPDETSLTMQRFNSRTAFINGSPLPYVFKATSGGPLFVATETTTRTWFSACYTYHVNLGNTLPDRIARHAAEARKLFGVELTPATLWNLAPWSWAVDWEGNIGDVLHNVSRFAQDGLVMRYGYIMQEKTCKIDYNLDYLGSLSGSGTRPLSMTVIAKSKIRRRATPFGFGFDMTALTGRQSAILGALGISRGPRHL